MSKNIKSKRKLHSEHALLCLLGQKCVDKKLLEPLYKFIKISQKTVKNTPVEKLIDALLAILLDCDVVSQINTKLAIKPGFLKPLTGSTAPINRLCRAVF